MVGQGGDSLLLSWFLKTVKKYMKFDLVTLGDHKMQDMVDDDRTFRYVPRFRRAGGGGV